tara:strand:- start:63 stop:431 length:369 start_codon:yes stop_codon:yes gene_type:complete
MNKPSELEPIFDNGKLGFTENQFYYLTNNEKYVDVLNSKLYRFIFSICKWSGFNSHLIFKNIPYIDNFTSDKDIYRLFKLTKQEIELIENNTKDFKEIKGGFKSKKYKLNKSKKSHKHNKSI